MWKSFKFLTTWQAPGIQKDVLTNQIIEFSELAVETLLTVQERFFVSS